MYIWIAGWIENPINSVVLTFPLDKIVFPTVTLCPRDSRPDRWGTAIKIFDQVNTHCGSKRQDFLFNSKARDLIWYSLQRFMRMKKITLDRNSSLQLRTIIKEFYSIVIKLWSHSSFSSFYNIPMKWICFGYEL